MEKISQNSLVKKLLKGAISLKTYIQAVDLANRGLNSKGIRAGEGFALKNEVIPNINPRGMLRQGMNADIIEKYFKTLGEKGNVRGGSGIETGALQTLEGNQMIKYYDKHPDNELVEGGKGVLAKIDAGNLFPEKLQQFYVQPIPVHNGNPFITKNDYIGGSYKGGQVSEEVAGKINNVVKAMGQSQNKYDIRDAGAFGGMFNLGPKHLHNSLYDPSKNKAAIIDISAIPKNTAPADWSNKIQNTWNRWKKVPGADGGDSKSQFVRFKTIVSQHFPNFDWNKVDKNKLKTFFSDKGLLDEQSKGFVDKMLNMFK